jgi:type III pantothenate kinase
MLEQAQIPGEIHAVACCSVVPAWDPTLRRLARLLCDADIFFLRTGDQVGVKVNYDPPSSLGADRVANVLGALKQHKPPVIVIDFGSATTLDVITDAGFVGGAILPGVAIQAEAISRRAAQLPKVPLSVPHKVIANNTMEALQAGIILGHVSAIEGLVARIKQELGTPATVVATGGLSHLFMGATPAIHHFVPQLTLDGIAAAYHDQHLTADPG